jgi:hypothetical protein
MSSSPAARSRRGTRAPLTSFTKARAFGPAETHASSVAGDEGIRILPAKHGFGSLTDWLEPYDARFGQDGSISDEELGRQAEPLAWSAGAIIILGGVQDVR